ncbi:hypothetical protein PG993_012737 [Apiospora rasikravindrae]|uniref:Uncharacterized protein n=1 Tax=Apiospora rasikravindrae TaxID=990691 RepID=A0ABR1RVM8_9PEZI
MLGAIDASGIIGREDMLYLSPQYIAYKASGPEPQQGWLQPLLLLRRTGERVVAFRGGCGHGILRCCVSKVCANTRISTPFCPWCIRNRLGGPIHEDNRQLLQTLLAISAYTDDVALGRHLLSNMQYPLPLIATQATEKPRALLDEPLVAAAFTGHDEVLRLFLNYKLQDPDRWNAPSRETTSTVKLALSLESDVRDPYGEKLTAVFGCLEYVNDVKIFDLLYTRARHFLHRGVVPYHVDSPRFWTENCLPGPMCKAAKRGNVPLMRYLMELGAAPEPGITPECPVPLCKNQLEGCVWCAADTVMWSPWSTFGMKVSRREKPGKRQ